MRNSWILITMSLLFAACQTEKQNLLEKMLSDRGGVVSEVYQDAAKHRLQILYTQIDRDEENRPHFSSYSFRMDESEYFYPASTVKFPAAVLALEKLNQLGIEGLDRQTTLGIDSTFSGQSKLWTDSSSANNLPSIGHYIKKIMLVSDNDAFNRLYEFIGQEELNQKLWEKGFNDTKISHRLSIVLSEEENRHTNPFFFYQDADTIYRQEAKVSKLKFPETAPILLGKGEMQGGKRLENPKDFSTKNAFPIEEQQEMLRYVFFPNSVMGSGKSSFSPSDREFLWKYMAMLPGESDYPAYVDADYYYDSYVKFFMFGDKKEAMPKNIRIFNKVGVAYGFLTDNAYIVDFERGVEFMLSASIFVNENQIFNDNTYEYDEIGFPFLADLGRMIYEFELKRKKDFEPNLEQLKALFE